MHARVGHGTRLARRAAHGPNARADLRPRAAGVESVSPTRAAELLDSGGWVLLDVRPLRERTYTVVGAISVPVVCAAWSSAAFARRVRDKASGRGVVVMCERGADLSLLAAWALRGNAPAVHLLGGSAAWRDS